MMKRIFLLITFAIGIGNLVNAQQAMPENGPPLISIAKLNIPENVIIMELLPPQVKV